MSAEEPSMIDPQALLADARQVTDLLVDDLRTRTYAHDETRIAVRGVYEQAASVGRTDRSWEDWREDLLAQVASGWTLASVFVRFCEDNRLVETPLLSGPEHRRSIARDHRAAFLAANPTADDRHWLVEVFERYRKLPGIGAVLGVRNPLWQIEPGPDGARSLLELWWRTDDEGRRLRHDFTDAQLSTRFLGDLYQDLSEHARKQYALLQTPEFVESFILDRTLDPAIEAFGLDEVRMIDPTCGSGHFLLGAFDRLMHRWQEREPHTPAAALAQRALDAVHGVDINSFAVAIARFRLLVAALQAAEIGRLEDAPDFQINVATGDSLLHGTHGGRLFPAEDLQQVVAHHYPTEDVELAGRILQADHYHAVVGNPPYITVKDRALNTAYRSLFETCYRQYSLGVPFTERFFQLATSSNPSGKAGYVGMITANSFMKREFGKKLIEEYLPRIDLTHVIDTSGAYIPGHGTPTVILMGRNRCPADQHLRAVLGIRGEPGRPDDAANGLVWSSISDLVDRPGSENDYVSVESGPRRRFGRHPWSLQGGGASNVMARIDAAASSQLEATVDDAGSGAVTREDDVYLVGRGPALRSKIETTHVRRVGTGEDIRDWAMPKIDWAIWPYNAQSLVAEADQQLVRFLWPYRRQLSERVAYGRTQIERGLAWYEYSMFFDQRFRKAFSIAFAEVATHNHFVLDRGGTVFTQTAPVIKLHNPDGVSEDDHLALLGLLNSSVADFWVKQAMFNKGNGGIGGGIGDEAWEPRYQRDSTKLKRFPIPDAAPLHRAQQLDRLAQELAEVLPSAVAKRQAPTAAVLRDAAAEGETLRHRMVALQEELDWECYRLYGLLDENVTCPSEELPPIRKGERAFEIALARRVAAGEATTSWFERHGATPITEVPAHWPEGYRQLVERRLELLEADRAIKLLERPEYKRRWNWDTYDDLAEDAQELWLLDRLEAWASEAEGEDPQPTTVARLADRLSADAEARQVAQDLAGVGADLVKLVDRLVRSAGVPYLAAYRLKTSGLRKRAAWERTWELQRVEDAIDARTALPNDHSQHLSEAEAKVARKEAGVDRIPVPPKYTSSDYRDSTTWRLRGKLDVPKERFVLYLDTRIGADATLVVGWAGWDHLEQARALAGLYTARSRDGAERGERARLLAGIAELVPWLLQWHDEPDPVYGERMGQTFDGFVTAECAALGLTRDDLAVDTPLTLDR
jgi:hypothetical protein